MLTLLLAFAVSCAVTLLLIRSAHRHARFSADHDLSGPQKFHARSVPRVGGVGIFAALVATAAALWWRYPGVAQQGMLLLACGLPAFGAGLVEDLTKRVSPRRRLIATAVSGSLGVVVLQPRPGIGHGALGYRPAGGVRPRASSACAAHARTVRPRFRSVRLC